jgi:hypothetical protein
MHDLQVVERQAAEQQVGVLECLRQLLPQKELRAVAKVELVECCHLPLQSMVAP